MLFEQNVYSYPSSKMKLSLLAFSDDFPLAVLDGKCAWKRALNSSTEVDNPWFSAGLDFPNARLQHPGLDLCSMAS